MYHLIKRLLYFLIALTGLLVPKASDTDLIFPRDVDEQAIIMKESELL